MDFYMTRNELYNFVVCSYTDLNFSFVFRNKAKR